MRTILVLTSTYPRWHGDTEPAFVHYLCRQLAADYRVVVLAPHYPGARRHEVIDGIEVYRFRYFFPAAEHLAYDGGIITNIRKNRLKLLLVPFFLLSQLFNAVRLARRHDISLIHAHWIIPQGLIALLVRRLSGRNIPVLSTSHGGDLFSLRTGLLESLKKHVLRNSDAVTVVSTTMKQRLQSMGMGTDTVSVQSMGVDLQHSFAPDSSATRTRDLVFVGRLVEKKGIASLLEAMRMLAADHPDLTLAIVGDGPDRPMLEQLATDLEVSEHIEFTGSVPNNEVPAYYRSARIAVVPSVVAADGDQEGLGLVAVEALGCGCATVVSDLPALRDVVTDGENGLVFRSGDAGDLAAKIRLLLTDTALFSRLVDRGRLSVLDKFDWQTVGAGYRTLIERVITAKSAR